MSEAYTFSGENHAPQLRNGDHMKQPTFHALYEQMPETFKAELVGGTVFVSMPLGRRHATGHAGLTTILGVYAAHTPGVELLLEPTTILGEEDEVQPDIVLRILPDFGGRSRTTYDEYIEGPPELICEVAYSSRAIDLHLKRKRYSRTGALEYLVFCLAPKEIRWFDFANKNMIELDSDRIYRSKIFPGLWIDKDALLQSEYAKALEVLHRGLDSTEHTEFIENLRKRELDC